MQYLFQSWPAFLSDIRAARNILLLSDYDGTLTPIVSRPEEAILAPEVRAKLQALVTRPALRIGIISGRSLAETKSMVGIEGIYYAGNHGLEIEGPAIKFVNPDAGAARANLARLKRQFSAALSNTNGIIIEDKGLSLSIHYRLVEKGKEVMVADVVRRITAPWLGEGKIRLTAGKKVWEIRPPLDWHKGKAVETILTKLGATLANREWLTIYLGDDTTDEDVFRILHRPQGWSIFVGRESTDSNAEYFLNSTSEVADFLDRLIGLT